MHFIKLNEISILPLIILIAINGHITTALAQNCMDTHRRVGRCIGLAACPQMMEQFYAETGTLATNVDFQTYVSNSICGFDGRNFLICCVVRSITPGIPANILPTSRPARLQTFPSRFATTTVPPNYEYSLGSLFQFAPLTALSGSGGVAYTSPPPQAPTFIYPTISPNPNTSPVIFQPSSPSNPTMVLPTPQAPFNPTSPTLIVNPNPPPIVLNPAPPGTQPGGPSIPVTTGNCGISRGTTNRVVGGVETRRGAYPWIAALGYYDGLDRNNIKFLCAGSLISPTYVLTSAHCVSSTLAVVRLGAHDLSRTTEPNAIDYGVKRTVVHEGFDLRSIANDIALIELNTPASMTDFIGTICLPVGSNFLTQDFVGMQPFVAGWGAVKHQGPTSNVLRDAQVPVVNRQTCEQSYKSVFRFIEFSDKLICAGNSNVDACQGDSGGPLMMPTQMDGGIFRYVLLGIVSYGYECARSGFPGVYTRVASYIPWILSHQT